MRPSELWRELSEMQAPEPVSVSRFASYPVLQPLLSAAGPTRSIDAALGSL
jgi:hypothetical protein